MNLLCTRTVAFFVCFVNYFLTLVSFYSFSSFVVNYDFVFFPRTRLIEPLYFFFCKENFIVLARSTSANWRTNTIDFSTTTIIVFATLCAVASILIYFGVFNHNMFVLKGLFVYGFGLVYDKLSGIIILFCVKTIKTPTIRSTMS